ncbi:MAG: sugar phosphate isomerase/epimerase [Candidatus Omnitrophica bacterium]|nr:sugar phosphate isomerase/epimerase [Candidatus Omnitrophota bacterium]
MVKLIYTVDEAVELVKELEYDNLKILPDTFHMNIDEADFAKSIVRGGNLISLVHFADSNRLAPGQGHTDFDKIMGALSKISYSGYICAEVLPRPNDQTAMEQSAGFFNKMKCR